MDNQKLLLGFAALIVAASLSFVVGLNIFGVEDRELYSSSFDLSLDSGNQVETVEFDGKTIDVMFEPAQNRAYLDTDRDGSADLTMELESEGSNTVTQVATLGQDSYRFYFRYSVEKDYLTLYQVRQL